jgi:peptidoglycan/LPS O-acetylase OafA/YrhL
MLAWGPLAMTGRISYGLYLWHYLLIWSELPIVVVWASTFVIAGLSYVVIERPFLRLKQRLLAPRLSHLDPNVRQDPRRLPVGPGES